MDKLTPAILKVLRHELTDAMQDVASKHGIAVNIGTARYTSTSATFKLEVRTCGTDSDGGLSVDAADFKRFCAMFGMTPDMLGKQFRSWDGKLYTIVTVKPNNRKYPVIATNANGKRFKFPVAQVMQSIQK